MPHCDEYCPRFQFPRRPRSILVVKKRGPGSDEVRYATGALLVWLIQRKHCAVWMERAEAEEMSKEQQALRGTMREPPQTDDNEGREANHGATRTEQRDEATAASSSASGSSPAPAAQSAVSLPAGLYPLSSPLRTSEIALIDFSISMGGDGTVLHLNALLNSLGEHTRMPPLLSFALGTLGFLTNLYFDEYQPILERVMNAYEKPPHQRVKEADADGPTLQQKTTTEAAAIVAPKPQAAAAAAAAAAPAALPPASPDVVPSSPAARSTSPCSSCSASPSPSASPAPANDYLMLNPRMRLHVQVFRRVVDHAGGSGPSSSSSHPRYTFVGSYTCLNEVLVHRAASPFLASIDIQLLERHAPKGSEPFYITTVHGDGLMASTPTGSTAYSMAAGGPLIAPNSDSMVLTPVSPHSLSFRPIILSSCASVRFVIAANSRLGITERMVDGTVTDTPPPPCDGAPARRWAAVASMDNHYQVLLAPGDYVQITASRYPLMHMNLHYPHMSNESQWLHNLTMKLHWNLTQSQLRLLEEQAKRGRNNQPAAQRPHHPHHDDAVPARSTAAAGTTSQQQEDPDPFAPREKPASSPAAAPATAQPPSSDKQQLQRLSQLPSNM